MRESLEEHRLDDGACGDCGACARPSSMWAINSTSVAIRTNPWHEYKVNEWNSIQEHDIYLDRNRFEMPRGLSTYADWDRFDGRQRLWGFQSSLFTLEIHGEVSFYSNTSRSGNCSKAHGERGTDVLVKCHSNRNVWMWWISWKL